MRLFLRPAFRREMVRRVGFSRFKFPGVPLQRALFPGVLWLLVMGLGLQPGDLQADYKSLQNDTDANAVSAAKVLVAPSRSQMALRINRIRVTSSVSVTSPSYLFVSNNSTKMEGETSNLTTCDLPTCQILLAIESVQEGMPYDYTDLGFRLMPGDRLYFFATADVGLENTTLEVWYSEVMP